MFIVVTNLWQDFIYDLPLFFTSIEILKISLFP